MSKLPKPTELDGGSIIAKILSGYGIECIFTLCGGHISPILVGAQNEGIRVIDLRHEVNAIFAADAMARITGRPSVVAVTAGPGVSNTITAIKNAEMAQSPIIIIGGAPPTLLRGRGSLQDIDQISLIKSTTKWHKSVSRVSDILPTMINALQISKSGVPGPVFLEFPLDILYPETLVEKQYNLSIEKIPKSLSGKVFNWYIRRHLFKIFEDVPSKIDALPQYLEFPEVVSTKIEEVKNLIDSASKPICLISSQVMSNPDIINELVHAIENIQIPVYLSSAARGLLGKNHTLQFRHHRRKALAEADLILLIGVAMDFRLDYGRSLSKSATIVAVNIDKTILNMNRLIRNIDLKIQANPSSFLLALGTKTRKIQWEEWVDILEQREREREEEIDAMQEASSDYVNPLFLFSHIEDIMADDSTIIADGGDFVATMSYIIQPRGPLRWLDPGPFGTLGVGGGFAIGAKLSRPSSETWLFYGDGAAGYSIMEFDSMKRHQIPIIAIIGNDGSWQQIAREQIEMFGTDIGTRLNRTHYEEVAKALGAEGFLIRKNEEVKQILRQALDVYHEGRSVVVNVLIDQHDFRKGSLSM